MIKPGEKYESIEINMQKDETLLLYTDGLTESQYNGKLFSQKGVRSFVKENNLSLDELIRGLAEEARNFSHDNLTDDILILGLKKT